MFYFRRQPITVPYFPKSSTLIGYQRNWNISAVEVDIVDIEENSSSLNRL